VTPETRARCMRISWWVLGISMAMQVTAVIGLAVNHL
jgi:hypothetical protein